MKITSIFLSSQTLELNAFKNLDEKETKLIADFISNCTVIDINRKIKDSSIELRRKHKLKLPDCIVAATAQYLAIPFFTADADFKNLTEITLIYYEPGDEN